MRIALFASGTGNNVKNIINYFSSNDNVKITSVFSNRENAGALDHARSAKIPTRVFTSLELREVGPVLDQVLKDEVDLIVLAGFLLKIPEELILKFSGKIINLHPSLLPKYGGKGMYGNNVHKAVLAAKEKKTGITIHYVNEQYDKGKIIDQFETTLSDKDNLEDVLLKIKDLERKYFPSTIEKLSLNR